MYKYIENQGDDGPYSIFNTDFGLTYIVSFRWMGTSSFPLDHLYSVDFIEENGQKRKVDSKVSATIRKIIVVFTQKNPGCVLHYLCDIAGGKQKYRARLFSKWFSMSATGHWTKLDVNLDTIDDYQLSFLYDANRYSHAVMESEISMTLGRLEAEKSH